MITPIDYCPDFGLFLSQMQLRLYTTGRYYTLVVKIPAFVIINGGLFLPSIL